MQLQLIRNATLKITYAGKTLLVDPMLSPKHGFQSFAGKEENPTVDLPMPADDVIASVDAVLVTHTHTDHFDPPAIAALARSLPLFCQPADVDKMLGFGFEKVTSTYPATFGGIDISRTGGKHGSGAILEHMGDVSGFLLKAEGEPTVYIIGDSIWVDDVESALSRFHPDVIVTNSGGAIIPGFESTPILMEQTETVRVAEAVPSARVIAVHLEALDHCGVTRASIRNLANEKGISDDRLLIPADGEVLEL